MTSLAATEGYASSTIAEVIDRAGVSRKTFYALFTSREELLRAAFGDCARIVLGEVQTCFEQAPRGTPKLEAMVGGLCASAIGHPGAIALCTVDVAALHSDGMRLREALMGDYARLIQASLSFDGEPPLPDSLAVTLAGALHRQIDASLRVGAQETRATLAHQLVRWLRSYHPMPPGALDGATSRTPWSSPGTNGLAGGRAPGTLALAPNDYLRRRGKAPSAFVAHTNRERILDAVAQLNAKIGYPALTADAIAVQAKLPLGVFRAQFTSTDEAFAAAVELGHIKAQAIVERARAEASSWKHGVRSATAALLEFFASEPLYTRLALIDAPLARSAPALGPEHHVLGYATLLFDGAPQRRRPTPIAREAIVYALFELVSRHTAEDRSRELPSAAAEASYLVLAPFLGAAAA